MRARAMLLAGVVLSGILTACPYPRETIRFASDERIVRGQWEGKAQRHCPDIYDAVWSPDGSKVFTHSSRTVVWNAETGARLRVFEGVGRAVWGADSKQLGLWKTEYDSNTNTQRLVLAVVDVTTGQTLRSLVLPPLPTIGSSDVTFLPDLSAAVVLFSTAVSGQVQLVNLADGQTIRSFDLGITNMQLNPTNLWLSADGSTLAASGFTGTIKPAGLQTQTSPPIYMNGFVRAWSTANGQARLTKTGLFGTYNPVVISPDGTQLVYLNANGRTALVRLADDLERELEASPPPFAAFSSDGATYLALGRKTLDFWDTATLTKVRQVPLVLSGSSQPRFLSVGGTRFALDDAVRNGFGQTCPLRVFYLTDGAFERTLDEGVLDEHTLALNLQAMYANEFQYAIAGTASVDGQALTVRGTGSAGDQVRFQAVAPQPMRARLELLNPAGQVIWVLGSNTTFFPGDVSVSQQELVGTLNQVNENLTGERFSFGLKRKP